MLVSITTVTAHLTYKTKEINTTEPSISNYYCFLNQHNLVNTLDGKDWHNAGCGNCNSLLVPLVVFVLYIMLLL